MECMVQSVKNLEKEADGNASTSPLKEQSGGLGVAVSSELDDYSRDRHGERRMDMEEGRRGLAVEVGMHNCGLEPYESRTKGNSSALRRMPGFWFKSMGN